MSNIKSVNNIRSIRHAQERNERDCENLVKLRTILEVMLNYCKDALSEAKAKFASLQKGEKSPSAANNHFLGFKMRNWLLKLPMLQTKEYFKESLPNNIFNAERDLCKVVMSILDVVGELHKVARKNRALEEKVKNGRNFTKQAKITEKFLEIFITDFQKASVDIRGFHKPYSDWFSRNPITHHHSIYFEPWGKGKEWGKNTSQPAKVVEKNASA